MNSDDDEPPVAVALGEILLLQCLHLTDFDSSLSAQTLALHWEYQSPLRT